MDEQIEDLTTNESPGKDEEPWCRICHDHTDYRRKWDSLTTERIWMVVPILKTLKFRIVLTAKTNASSFNLPKSYGLSIYCNHLSGWSALFLLSFFLVFNWDR